MGLYGNFTKNCLFFKENPWNAILLTDLLPCSCYGTGKVVEEEIGHNHRTSNAIESRLQEKIDGHSRELEYLTHLVDE